VVADALGLVANLRVRNAATVGGNIAEGDPTSDLPAVFAALGGTVQLKRKDGDRTIELSDFFVDHFETAAEPEEFVADISIYLPAPHWDVTYLKLASRSTDDRTCLGVAACIGMEDGRCTGLRVAVAGAAGTPIRSTDLEDSFVGHRLDDIDEFAASLAATSDPVTDLRGSAEYRKRVLRPLVTRAVRSAAHGSTGAWLA
jgi:carbon-monoxide dehydrogenase medium subunit